MFITIIILSVLLLLSLVVIVLLMVSDDKEIYTLKKLFRAADYMHSSRNVRLVPFRLSMQVGHFHYSLSQKDLEDLFEIFLFSDDLHGDMEVFKKDVIERAAKKKYDRIKMREKIS